MLFFLPARSAQSASSTSASARLTLRRDDKLPTRVGSALLLCHLLFLLILAMPIQAETLSGDRYLCWTVEAALDDLRQQGLRVLSSSDLVHPELQITTAPAGDTPAAMLEAILEPFGLTAEAKSDDVYLVVRRPGHPGVSAPRPVTHAGGEAVLPRWSDLDKPFVERRFPAPASEQLRPIPSDATRLVIRVEATSFEDWSQAAFALKNRIVEARSQAPQVQVALEGDPATLDRLVDEGLAPYVDAVTYDDEPFTLAKDPTARRWRRVQARQPHDVLQALLRSGAQGDEAVLFENHRLTSEHRLFLDHIVASGAADLGLQPRVFGIDAERVRFFLEPQSGHHFLAVYVEPGGESFRFSLGSPQAATLVYPGLGGFDVTSTESTVEVTLDGRSAHYLIELEPRHGETISRDVQVRAERIVDPYEEVVKNQVFQQRERAKFESLDVMEYLTQIPLAPGADQGTWEHRIIQRKGKLTDYHHLGYQLNGVPIPQDRLLRGRIYRSEALIQLKPLEVELDETYHYQYLGDEVIDGVTTYKIAFEPLRRGTREDGSFVSGIVWIDPKTSAHHRIRAVQRGLDGTLISQERTTDYTWIPSNGQCFWDWRHRHGTSTTVWLGEQYTTRTETERTGFRYNRPDIEEVVRQAYASDILIHVESPPEGHRWLVREGGTRRLAGLTHTHGGSGAALEQHSLDSTTGPSSTDPGSSENPTRPMTHGNSESSTTDYGDRVLADVHAFSTRTRFSLFGDGESGDFDLYPGFTVTDSDFLDRGYQAYLGLFLEDAILSLGLPNLFGRRWTLTGRLFLPYEGQTTNATFDTGVGPRNVSARVYQPTFSLSLGVPLGRKTTLNTAYFLVQSEFDAAPQTDPAFVVPTDTLEHGIDVSVNHRWGRSSGEIGVELGRRDDWRPWGLEGGAPLEDSYQVYRASLASSWRLGRPTGQRHQTLSAALGLWKGVDLDPYSRVRNGRARAGLVGFDNDLGFDQAAILSLTYATRLFGRAVNFRLDDAVTRIEDAPDSIHRIGFRFRFLVHGPWRLDLWPSINVSLYSTEDDEAGDVTLGLFLQRRQ